MNKKCLQKKRKSNVSFVLLLVECWYSLEIKIQFNLLGQGPDFKSTSMACNLSSVTKQDSSSKQIIFPLLDIRNQNPRWTL